MKKNMTFIFMGIFIFMFSGCSQKTLDSMGEDAKKFYEEKIGTLQTPSKNPSVSRTQVYSSDQPILLILLDASASMMEKDQSNTTKLNAAKRTISDIVGQLDNTKTNAGLIAFSNGCYSTQLLVEPNNKDFSRIIDKVENIQAHGNTPLAASIRKAGEILSGVDQKVRLLVISDGKETCGGNPAYEAEKLMTKYNIEPIIYVVGYNVDRNTKLQLEEIAAIGKGSYFDVKDSATLNKTINSIISKEKIKNPNFSSDGKIYKFNVNFKTDSDVVESQYVDDIQGLAAYLKANNYSAEIQGHTDSVGLQEYNRKLSAYRAKSVLEKLVDMGVDRNKLTSAGYGDSKPLVSNSTEEGKFKNRRVEAHIVK